MGLRVEPFNPEWIRWFQEVEEFIQPALEGLDAEVVHVGSTSIPGALAKPVVDVDVVLGDWGELGEVVGRLESLGYKHQGDLGIPRREAFQQPPGALPPHHLYVVSRGSAAHLNHILVKKHLSENPSALRRYNELKRKLVARGATRDDYQRCKTGLLLEFLEEEGLDPLSLREVADSNRPRGERRGF